MKPRPNIQSLRSCISYNPHTGICTWFARPRHFFSSDGQYKSWNSRFAGKEAGCVCKFGSNSYKTITFDHMTIKVHRVIWALVTGGWPDEIDHKDGNGLNNKIENLSDSGKALNMKNKRRYKNKEDGLPTGVYRATKGNRYWAEINSDNKRVYLGKFRTMAEAAEARKRAELKYKFSDRHGSN